MPHIQIVCPPEIMLPQNRLHARVVAAHTLHRRKAWLFWTLTTKVYDLETPADPGRFARVNATMERYEKNRHATGQRVVLEIADPPWAEQATPVAGRTMPFWQGAPLSYAGARVPPPPY